MSHLEHETLWNRQALTEPAVVAHLSGCAECRAALEEVTIAQQVLIDLPDVPPMPEAMARRVGVRLAEEADARAAKSVSGWWRALTAPRLVFAMGVVALVAFGAWVLAPHAEVTPTAPIALPTPVPEVPPAPAPVEAPQAPKLAVKAKRQVTVASAKKSTATLKQVLEEGAVITTQRGGSTWLQLPDGSRAGVTSDSQVTLATLEDATLTLEVGRGSLAMVVPHREDRVLTVRAGEMTVRDLGTRFVVSNEPGAVVVAVEEGVVEVDAPSGTIKVTAGQVVTWKAGKMRMQTWERPVAAPPAAPSAVTPVEKASDEPSSVAKLEEEEDDAPLPAQTAPPVVVSPAPPAVSEKAFTLKSIERKLREFGATLDTKNGREARAKNVTLAADSGDCGYALKLADSWLRETVTRAANEPTLRRSVLTERAKCLNAVGRFDEARAVEKLLSGETK